MAAERDGPYRLARGGEWAAVPHVQVVRHGIPVLCSPQLPLNPKPLARHIPGS